MDMCELYYYWFYYADKQVYGGRGSFCHRRVWLNGIDNVNVMSCDSIFCQCLRLSYRRANRQRFRSSKFVINLIGVVKKRYRVIVCGAGDACELATAIVAR